MPLITVWNAHQTYDKVKWDIIDACLGIEELGLKKPAEVSVCFVPDMDPSWVEETVVVVVELLFDKPGRTQAVRQRLAEAIGRAIKDSTVGHNRPVEVAVKRFNPERDAFWSC